ncbi:MAG: hypothetical protein Kow0022_16840 [Phycisphaerales bacterium]
MVWSRVIVSALLGMMLAGCEQGAATAETKAPASQRAPAAPSGEQPGAGASAEPLKKHASPPEEEAASAPEVEPDVFHRYGLREPRPRTAGTIRIATYNIENLFDDKDDPALSGRFEDIDDTKPAAQCEAVAQTIRRIDADVLAVEEVESEDVLIAFRDTYLSDMGYDYVVSLDAGDERGIEQGVLSRYPIVARKQWVRMPLGGVHPAKYGSGDNWYAGEEIVFHRSPLMVEVEVPPSVTGGEPYRLTLLAVHSKSGAPAGYWREAEARGMVQVIGELMKEDPDRNLVVLGDFNATRDAESMQILERSGLIDVIGDRSGPEWISHASGRRIDHLLANPQAMEEIVPESAFILGTTVGVEGMDWRDAAQLPGYASDHFPVVVDLKVRR